MTNTVDRVGQAVQQTVRQGASRYASSGAASRAAGTALGQTETASAAEPGGAGSFTAGAQPDTGTVGDARLPFTGSHVLLLLAIGAGVLLTGLLLRTATRLRPARRHGH